MQKQNLKSEREINLIEKSCFLTDRTFNYILGEIKEGITEHKLSLKIQRFIRKNSASLAFRPIVSFGKNSFEIHHRPNQTELQKGQIIMLDFGAKADGYCSDMTRTIFFGKANDKQERMYRTVLEAQKKAVEFLVSSFQSPVSEHKSVKARDVDDKSRSYIISKGYPSIPHSLGHGLGKKVHEGFRLSPKSKIELLAGMVFTIEPGIYIKNFGGIRIEDTVVLDKQGLRILTHSTKDLIEL